MALSIAQTHGDTLSTMAASAGRFSTFGMPSITSSVGLPFGSGQSKNLPNVPSLQNPFGEISRSIGFPLGKVNNYQRAITTAKSFGLEGTNVADRLGIVGTGGEETLFTVHQLIVSPAHFQGRQPYCAPGEALFSIDDNALINTAAAKQNPLAAFATGLGQLNQILRKPEYSAKELPILVIKDMIAFLGVMKSSHGTSQGGPTRYPQAMNNEVEKFAIAHQGRFVRAFNYWAMETSPLQGSRLGFLLAKCKGGQTLSTYAPHRRVLMSQAVQDMRFGEGARPGPAPDKTRKRQLEEMEVVNGKRSPNDQGVLRGYSMFRDPLYDIVPPKDDYYQVIPVHAPPGMAWDDIYEVKGPHVFIKIGTYGSAMPRGQDSKANIYWAAMTYDANVRTRQGQLEQCPQCEMYINGAY